MSSSKDAEPETKIDTNVVELKYDQGHQFVIKKGNEVVPGSIFKWDSSDENESLGFYASNGRVSFTNGKLSADSKIPESSLKTLKENE